MASLGFTIKRKVLTITIKDMIKETETKSMFELHFGFPQCKENAIGVIVDRSGLKEKRRKEEFEAFKYRFKNVKYKLK